MRVSERGILKAADLRRAAGEVRFNSVLGHRHTDTHANIGRPEAVVVALILAFIASRLELGQLAAHEPLGMLKDAGELRRDIARYICQHFADSLRTDLSRTHHRAEVAVQKVRTA